MHFNIAKYDVSQQYEYYLNLNNVSTACILNLHIKIDLVNFSTRNCTQAVNRHFLHADSEDSDQTGRMLGTYAISFVLSWGGLNSGSIS